MPVDIPVVRGDSKTWTLTLTIAGVTDLTDWAPLLQFRATTGDDVAVEPELLGIDGMTIEWGLTAAQTAALPLDGYLWDVQVTDPGADEGYGVSTWPPAVDDDGVPVPRNTLTVVGDVSRGT